MLTDFRSIASFLGILYITFATRSEFVRPWTIPVFTASYPLQLVLTAVMGLFGHARQVSHFVKWDATRRG